MKLSETPCGFAPLTENTLKASKRFEEACEGRTAGILAQSCRDTDDRAVHRRTVQIQGVPIYLRRTTLPSFEKALSASNPFIVESASNHGPAHRLRAPCGHTSQDVIDGATAVRVQGVANNGNSKRQKLGIP